MKTRTELLNTIADTINAKNYLEIGISTGENFNNIKVEKKVSVDIYLPCNATFPISSDDFFAFNKDKYDLIFIDGYHQKHQVYRDIMNSLACLTPNGVIVTHDTLPLSDTAITPIMCWDAWETFVHLRKTNPNIYMASILTEDDGGTGCGIIKHGKQTLFQPEIQYVTFDYYIQNITTLMNIIDIETLKTTLKSNNDK